MSKENSSCRNSLTNKIRSEWCDLDLTTKILLLIGLVLLLELIFSIFIRTVNTDATTDAFFRISLSSVLGYFLGGMDKNKPDAEEATVPSSLIASGEQTEKKPLDLHTLNLKTDIEGEFENTTHIRTLFIAFVCIACIITLSITTFYNQTEYTEGLIQLRNIISTTIGFLISKANRRN